MMNENMNGNLLDDDDMVDLLVEDGVEIEVFIVECDSFCDCFMCVLVDVENVCKCVEKDWCEVE